MTARKKRFGLSGSKFLAGIENQIDRADNAKRIEIQTIPISSVNFSPGNPRKLAITPEDITGNLPTLQLPPQAFTQTADNDWLESYETLVQETFGQGKEKDDFLSIALFAASIRSPERMLHPIVVWRDGGHFFKITGERRFLAHVLLGEPNIRASVWEEEPTKFERSVIQWDENNQRENFNLAEALDALEIIIDNWKEETGEKAISLAQFMNLASLKRTTAFRYLKIITNGTPKLRQTITEHRIDALTAAFEFASQDAERADESLAKFLSGAPQSAKDMRRERAKQGKRTRKSQSTRTPNIVNPLFVRKMRPKDAKVVGRMVSIMRSTFGKSPLDQELDGLSMENPKDVGVALQKVFEYVRSLADAAEEKKKG